tara:strand:+ start:77 stop:979 length:903 start_codon:yes stop_codon:yes gene_type:complete
MASNLRVDSIVPSTSGNVSIGTATGGVTIPGNLGIGGTLTYEDVTNIDSVGVITARSDLSIADKIIHTGDTNTAIRFPAADTITAETGGSERLRIDSSGKATFSGDVQIDGDELFIADSIKHVGDTDTLISFPSNDTINFRTAGTERLRIHSGGEVTKPSNPAFIVGRTGGNQTFTLGTFPFNVARVNVGNHYNTSTYKFTAPVAGVYYFYAQVYYNAGNGTFRVGFRKTPNGGSALMLNTAQHAMVGNDNQQSTSIIESLAVGDTVELYSDQNASRQLYYNINSGSFGAHTYFMGYLIG